MYAGGVLLIPPSRLRYVLYFGRISAEKGIQTLLKVCRKHPEIRFVFAGNGPLADDAKRISNIDYRGFVQGRKLQSLIRNAEFCVYPTEWYEVFGLAIGESIMLGTPVIASRIGGIPEIITHGENGELIDSGNEEMLSKVICKLWQNHSELDKYKKALSKNDFMDVSQYYQKLKKVYA